MVLRATITIPGLAAILRVSRREVHNAVESGDIASWRLSRGDEHQIGWREADRVIGERFADGPDDASRARDELRQLRAGAIRVRPKSEPPVLESADVPRVRTARRFSDQEILAALQVAGRVPGERILSPEAFDRLSPTRDLGSRVVRVELRCGWGAALRRAGLPCDMRRTTASHGDDELLDLVRRAAETVGRGEALTIAAFDRYATNRGLAVTGAGLRNRFGTFNAAKRRAGLATRERHRDGRSPQELLDLLIALSLDRDQTLLTQAYCDDWGKRHGAGALGSRLGSAFGCFNAAKAAAGLPARPRGFQASNGRTDRYCER